MAGEREWMPSDFPDFVQEAEAAMERGEGFDVPMPEEITIKFGKGLVGEPFISKNDKELVEVKIPNVDQEDKSPWASFVISPKMIHDNQFGKGVWMKVPADDTFRIGKPYLEGQNEEGKNIWKKAFKVISAKELKALMESYKTRGERGDGAKTSVMGSLGEKKEQVAKAQKTNTNEKKKTKAKGEER